MTNRARNVFAIALSCALAAPVASLAQSDPPELWTLITIEIEADMVREFEELQKELNAAYKKAGMTERRISQVIRGPATEYYIAEPVSKFASYDEPALMAKAMGETGAAQWVARVTKCVKNRRVDTLEARPDLSIPLAEGRSPKLMILRTYDNLPGRYPDYNNWLTSKWVPAMKKAGMNGVFYYRNAFGGSQRSWYVVSYVDSWAAFDGEHPVLRDLGEEAYRELRTGVGAMTHGPVRKILRPRPDLSIIP